MGTPGASGNPTDVYRQEGGRRGEDEGSGRRRVGPALPGAPGGLLGGQPPALLWPAALDHPGRRKLDTEGGDLGHVFLSPEPPRDLLGGVAGVVSQPGASAPPAWRSFPIGDLGMLHQRCC